MGYIKSNGAYIYYRKNLVKDSKAVIVINHGYGEHLGRYDYIVEKLNNEGYSVYRHDLRGHGKSKSKRGHIDSYDEFIWDTDKVVEKAILENKNKNIYMLGHSMGGMITLIYGLKYSEKLKGQIFSGPAVGTLPKVKGIKGKILKILGNILPNFKIRNLVGKDISRDLEVVEDYKNDPLVLEFATSKFFKEFLIDSIEYINKNICYYKLPCLILHGEEDKIVPLDISKNLYQKIASKDKKMISYKGLYHEILKEPEKDKVIEDIIFWLNNHL